MNPRHERKPGEVVFTILLLMGSAFLLWQSFGISGFQSWSSAGMFPMLAGLTMVITGVMALVAMFRQTRAPESGSGWRQFVAAVAPPQLLAGTAAVVAYMLLLDPLGFLLASYLFLVVAMRVFGSERWALNMGVSAAVLAAIYLIFSTVFSVVLPKGSWLAKWF